MDNTDRAMDTEAFRAFHKTGRTRSLRIGLVLAAVVVLGGAGVAGATAFAATQQSGSEGAAAGAQTPLTQADFVTSIQSGRSDATSVHYTMSMTSAGQTTDASGDISFGAPGSIPSLSMAMSVPDIASIDARLVDGTLYANLGELSQGKFIALAMDDASNPFVGSFAAIRDAADPTAVVGRLKDAILSVEPSGPAIPLDGVDATPYTLVVDSAALTGALSAADQAAIAGQQLTYQFWIGPDMLVRRMSFDFAGTAATMTFERWGQPVSIEPPPADQITTAPALS
ncbi:hypothetical protein ACEXOS_010145 [Herbiconiux sp. P16]|uniref:hypothetical protein n=1 Tax=Herbiconiux wuyangfengii TaxID=3342794 RepID=UPI0035B9777E